MTASSRYVIFAIGVALGTLVMIPVFQSKWAGREQRRQWEERRQLPGMFVEAAAHGIPLREEGQRFIVEEGVVPAPEGMGHRRVLVAGGRRKFAATGRALPDAFVKVTEDYVETQPDERSQVARFSFAYADRVRVRLADGAAEKLAARLADRGGKLTAEENGEWLVWTARHDLAAVPEMLDWLRTQTELVTAAEEIGIDWRAELPEQGK